MSLNIWLIRSNLKTWEELSRSVELFVDLFSLVLLPVNFRYLGLPEFSSVSFTLDCWPLFISPLPLLQPGDFFSGSYLRRFWDSPHLFFFSQGSLFCTAFVQYLKIIFFLYVLFFNFKKGELILSLFCHGWSSSQIQKAVGNLKYC